MCCLDPSSSSLGCVLCVLCVCGCLSAVFVRVVVFFFLFCIFFLFNWISSPRSFYSSNPLFLLDLPLSSFLFCLFASCGPAVPSAVPQCDRKKENEKKNKKRIKEKEKKRKSRKQQEQSNNQKPRVSMTNRGPREHGK